MSDLTVRRKILVAAAVVGNGTTRDFAVGDLIVECWRRWPEDFALAGHHQHADSNRVLSKLSGTGGLVEMGWIERMAPCTFRVRRTGLVVALGAAPELLADLRVQLTPRRAAPEPEPESDPAAETAAETEDVPFDSPAVRRAQPRVEPPPPLPDADVAAVVRLGRAEALRKFLRGSPLVIADAWAFWGVSPKTPRRGLERVDDVEQLLRRVVASLGASGPIDPRLPPLSTCYGLLNLHQIMRSRFARELDALAAQEGRAS